MNELENQLLAWIERERMNEFLTKEEVLFIGEKGSSVLVDDVQAALLIGGAVFEVLPSLVKLSLYQLKVLSWSLKLTNKFGESYTDHVIDLDTFNYSMNIIKEGVNVDAFRRSTVLIGPDHLEMRHSMVELQYIRVILHDLLTRGLIKEEDTELKSLYMRLQNRYRMFTSMTAAGTVNPFDTLSATLMDSASAIHHQLLLEDRQMVWIVFNWLLGIGFSNHTTVDEKGETKVHAYLDWNSTAKECNIWVWKLVYNTKTKLF